MKNQKQRKSSGTSTLVILLLIVTIISLALATLAWARYTTVNSGTAEGVVAKWNVEFVPGTDLFTETFPHVVEDRLAPGTNGKLDMNVTSKGTETDFDYRIILAKVTNKPTNLHFYTDEACTKELKIDGTNGIYGHVEYTTDANTPADIKETIYWKWAYQTDSLPTEIPAAALSQVKASLTVYAAEKSKTYNNQESIAEIKTAFGITNDTSDDAKALAKVINDAIDTVEGKAAETMSFDAAFTAIQCDPATGTTEFTDKLTITSDSHGNLQ